MDREDNKENNSVRRWKLSALFFALAFLITSAALAVVLTKKSETRQIESNGVDYGSPVKAKNAKEEIAKAKIVDNKVVTAVGSVARNDVSPMSASGPQQTGPLVNADIPEEAVHITASEKGFFPNEFTIKAGRPATIVLSSSNSFAAHSITFDDPALSAVFVGVVSGETRAITFNPPSVKGKYPFHCGLPGHAVAENGLMIVK